MISEMIKRSVFLSSARTMCHGTTKVLAVMRAPKTTLEIHPAGIDLDYDDCDDCDASMACCTDASVPAWVRM
jgi:hypothetical protein